MKKIFFMLWAVTALVGCSEGEQPVSESNRTVELTGTIIEMGATRGEGVIDGTIPSTTLALDVFRANSDAGGDYSGASWAKLAGSMASNTGEITLSPTQMFLNERSSRFIGVYPTEGTYVPEAGTITFPPLDGATDVMVSDFAEGNATASPDATLEFRHLLTKIQVDLKAAGLNTGGTQQEDDRLTEEVINSWGKVTKIELVGKKTGAVVTLPTPDKTVATPSIAADGGGYTNLLLTTKEGTAPPADFLKTTETTFGYAMFLPVESAQGRALTLNIHFENLPTQTVTTDAQQYEAGKGYRIIVVLEAQTAVSDTKVEFMGTFTWDNETVDQSKNHLVNTTTTTPQSPTNVPDGMTNSYMVNVNSTLTFRVARAYNYTDGDGFATTLRATNAEYTGEFAAGVLWADVANLIAGIPTVVGTGKDAVVSIKTNNAATYGNAVVALYKKDELTTPIWSYHIWVTAYDPYTVNARNPNNGIIFMDRNLGAKEAGQTEAARGLYYQWGRKDPFLKDNPAIGDGYLRAATNETSGTIQYTIEHPTTFITATTEPHDWYYGPEHNNDLWGNTTTKRFYDPCPSGWRVPSFNTSILADHPWKGMTMGEWSSNGIGGFTFADNAIYPSSGTISRSGIWYEDGGQAGGCFYATAAGGWNNGITVIALNIYKEKNSLAEIYHNDLTRKANGIYIRCVQE
jgi:hypothetical protein